MQNKALMLFSEKFNLQSMEGEVSTLFSPCLLFVLRQSHYVVQVSPALTTLCLSPLVVIMPGSLLLSTSCFLESDFSLPTMQQHCSHSSHTFSISLKANPNTCKVPSIYWLGTNFRVSSGFPLNLEKNGLSDRILSTRLTHLILCSKGCMATDSQGRTF